ncbi:MMPL family transporter [Sporichthya polymorpha]|uniref:MMPL family transporter n=1 Tax=Sporichthya polymorpha TaxID=35751 RepID=UPI00037356A3|nr:MMPL family transporter [Sporichthya polymorpha]
MAITADPGPPAAAPAPPAPAPRREALRNWGGFVARRPRRVLTAALVAVVAFAALTPVFLARVLGIGYDTPGSESARATAAVEQALGAQEAVLLVLSSTGRTSTDPTFTRAMDAALAVVRGNDGVVDVPPADLGGRVSDDGRVEYRTVLLSGDAGDRQKTAKELKHDLEELDSSPLGGPDIEIGLSGESPFFVDLLHSEEEGLAMAEAIGLPLAMLILFLTLGSILAAGLPVLTGLAGAVVALGILGAASFWTEFDIFAENGVVMLGIAVGIDYALLIVRRYREERTRADAETALATTMATAGRTVAFSGLTVMVALLPMALIDVPTLSKYALAGLLGVAGSVAMALILLPALLAAMGDRALTVRLKRMRERGFDAGGASDRWGRLARWVMKWPAAVLTVGTCVLICAAAPLIDVKQGIDLNVRAYEDEPSVRTLTTLSSAFPGITLGRVEVAVTGNSAAAATAQRVLAEDPRLTGVAVQELSTDSFLVTGNLTVPDDSKDAEDVVKSARTRLDAELGSAADADVGGTTARSIDYADQVLDKTPPIVIATLALCFLLLLVMLRSPVLALKAVIMNLLSIAAAMGLTVWVFQEGNGESLLDFSSPGYLQAWLPLTLFVILFGLSMDYEVFLVTRIREEYLRTGSNTEAIAAGLAKTGGVITSAALIMIAIFGAFMICPAPEIKQLGFGLAAAVLIDATIMRACLVPAFMKLAGRANWWCPRWLDRILPQLEHGETPTSPALEMTSPLQSHRPGNGAS